MAVSAGRIVRLTWAIVAVSVVSAVATSLQWYEIHSGSKDTHNLVEATILQAQAAQSSAATAELNVKAARENTVAASRAWYGPINAQMEQPISGQPISVKATLINSGHEPAKNVGGKTALVVFKSFEDAQIQAVAGLWAKQCLEEKSALGGVAYPGAAYIIRRSSMVIPVNANFSADVLSGEGVAYFFGCMKYLSQGEVRHSSFCFRYKKDEGELSPMEFCSYGNSAD